MQPVCAILRWSISWAEYKEKIKFEISETTNDKSTNTNKIDYAGYELHQQTNYNELENLRSKGETRGKQI